MIYADAFTRQTEFRCNVCHCSLKIGPDLATSYRGLCNACIRLAAPLPVETLPEALTCIRCDRLTLQRVWTPDGGAACVQCADRMGFRLSRSRAKTAAQDETGTRLGEGSELATAARHPVTPRPLKRPLTSYRLADGPLAGTRVTKDATGEIVWTPCAEHHPPHLSCGICFDGDKPRCLICGDTDGARWRNDVGARGGSFCRLCVPLNFCEALGVEPGTSPNDAVLAVIAERDELRAKLRDPVRLAQMLFATDPRITALADRVADTPKTSRASVIDRAWWQESDIRKECRERAQWMLSVARGL